MESSEFRLESGVTSHYEIDQSVISISDMKKIFWGEAKQNPWDSTQGTIMIPLLLQ